MSDRLWLVRHTATAWTGHRWCGRTDLPLSVDGRRQAVELASWLAPDLPADVLVLSSPARRALETATEIATAARCTVDVVTELREVDFGDAEGRTWTEVERELPDLAAAIANGDPETDWPDGETAAEVRARAEIVGHRIDEAAIPLVLVTHGGLIRALLATLVSSGAQLDADLGPGAINALERADGRWAIPAGVVA